MDFHLGLSCGTKLGILGTHGSKPILTKELEPIDQMTFPRRRSTPRKMPFQIGEALDLTAREALPAQKLESPVSACFHI